MLKKYTRSKKVHHRRLLWFVIIILTNLSFYHRHHPTYIFHRCYHHRNWSLLHRLCHYITCITNLSFSSIFFSLSHLHQYFDHRYHHVLDYFWLYKKDANYFNFNFDLHLHHSLQSSSIMTESLYPISFVKVSNNFQSFLRDPVNQITWSVFFLQQVTTLIDFTISVILFPISCS